MRILLLAALSLGLPLPAAAAPALSPVADPALWPRVAARPVRDAEIEARLDALLARMAIDDKVGQLLQVDIASLTPADLLTWKLGSVLNGGNSDPNADPLAPPAEWLKLADKFYDASMTRSDGRPAIPVIWGTDAVHGNNNIFGATLFPHNIGLGAARDPALLRRIGEVTALETAAAGLDWTFAPTLAVVQDDRWGRTYESYSEEPALLASYATAMIEGLQGKVGTAEFLDANHVLATTKHFLGDGGTGGRDQGDTRLPEAEFRDVHLGGYPAAIAAGTQSVMASFSSWNGVKMSGNRSLLTGVLKDRMGFDGFVVGDWNSHGQVPGCSNEDCPAAINAGLDMFMYSGPNWKKLYDNTLRQARDGTIPAARARRCRPPHPARQAAGRTVREGPPVVAPAGRQVRTDRRAGPPRGRAACGTRIDRPAEERARYAAAGAQGGDPRCRRRRRQAQPAGRRLVAQLAGRRHAQPRLSQRALDLDRHPRNRRRRRGACTLSPDGSFTARPAAAIVVFGEQPYAEFKGDRPTVEYSPGDKADLQLLKKLKAAGIPVVAVFLSGRPLWVNAELNASDAFVAAFLPGTEGGAVAEVLFRKPDGAVNHDFRGKLSFSWPKRPDQFVLNRRDKPYDPLFAYGYGLSYAALGTVGALDETRPAGLASDAAGLLFGKGAAPQGWQVVVAEADGPTATLTGAAGRSGGAKLVVAGVDRAAQEDARRLTWTGPAELRLLPPAPIDLTRETNGEISLVVQFRVDAAGPLSVAMTDAAGKSARIALPATIAAARPGEWTSLAIPLQCFAKAGIDMAKITAPFVLASDGAAAISVSDVRHDYVNVSMTACTR